RELAPVHGFGRGAEVVPAVDGAGAGLKDHWAILPHGEGDGAPRTFRDNDRVDNAQLRDELEQLALTGVGFDALLRRLADATGRVVRLIAVHGGLLATSEDGVARPAASEPVSGVPASESLALGLEPAVARHALAEEHPT